MYDSVGDSPSGYHKEKEIVVISMHETIPTVALRHSITLITRERRVVMYLLRPTGNLARQHP